MTDTPDELDSRGAPVNPEAIRLDGVTLSRDIDFAALARDILAGRVGETGPNAIWPLDWLWRNYPRLIGTAYAAPLSRGVASCLDDTDTAILSQALAFFQEHSTAAGADHVEEVVEREREHLRGVDDPVHQGTDLETTALRALAARATESGRALALTRQVALEPQRGWVVAGMLTACDPDWVTAHAVDIVRTTPEAAIAIFVQLERLKRDYAALGESLARLADRDPKFRENVSSYLRDAAAKRRILAALGA